MSINYINERFQRFFVEETILKEENWYKSQGVEQPTVPFFENVHIIGTLDFYEIESNEIIPRISFFYLELFDHISNGIFPLLDDVCKTREPSVKIFVQNLRTAWNQNSKLKIIDWQCKSESTFTIHHFAGPVCYSTVNRFLDFFGFHLAFFKCIFRRTTSWKKISTLYCQIFYRKSLDPLPHKVMTHSVVTHLKHQKLGQYKNLSLSAHR